ncbi:RNA-directed DNA polymerase-like protein [Gossypium australe]|uniref:RNA-directed DNA polymerase-like protein n=1 Tax=Gossypium australe TaxID=47621 RepID=A0A5B6UZP0_9ROSI|nr:RNA-directed DNA polymerase-like protein [Gossypium australe]
MLRRYRSDLSHIILIEEIEVRLDLSFEEELIQILDREFYGRTMASKRPHEKRKTQFTNIILICLHQTGSRCTRLESSIMNVNRIPVKALGLHGLPNGRVDHITITRPYSPTNPGPVREPHSHNPSTRPATRSCLSCSVILKFTTQPQSVTRSGHTTV